MRTERGFTLVEVLVVMVVLAVGMMGFLQTTLVAGRLQGRSRAMTAGVFLAQEGLERIGALGWERATEGFERRALPDLLDGEGAPALEAKIRGGVRYLVVYQRESLSAGPPRCTVHCFWAEAGREFERRNAVRFAARRE